LHQRSAKHKKKSNTIGDKRGKSMNPVGVVAWVGRNSTLKTGTRTIKGPVKNRRVKKKRR